MQASDERDAFSQRLRAALDRAGWKGMGPAMLAREFNRRSANNITVHAARKWLMGESIPTQERLRSLAEWLGISAEWLRFGGAGQAGGQTGLETAGADVSALRADIEQLDAAQLRVVRELVALLLRS